MLATLTESDLRPFENDVDHFLRGLTEDRHEMHIMHLYYDVGVKGEWKIRAFKIFMSISVQVERKPVNLHIKM